MEKKVQELEAEVLRLRKGLEYIRDCRYPMTDPWHYERASADVFAIHILSGGDPDAPHLRTDLLSRNS